jgi:hypothetical protein
VDETIHDQYGRETGGGIDRSNPATLGGHGDTTYERAEEAERTVRGPYLLLQTEVEGPLEEREEGCSLKNYIASPERLDNRTI